MSQKKVEQYKKDKANRKKIIAKQKRQSFMRKTVAVLVGIVFVGFIGGSVYFKWFDKKSNETETVTYALSEKEISSAFTAYDESTGTAANENETTVTADSANDSSSDNTAETTAEQTTAEEETTEE